MSGSRSGVASRGDDNDALPRGALNGGPQRAAALRANQAKAHVNDLHAVADAPLIPSTMLET